ncbi:UNVERIFIED_CONTAM: hypothetical protein Slati_1459600 [Sesamum latifolium]|uniref:Uncharacterized protein n=1 Tax=Sesamum latifolium TaxID=2727402 RepID=A0AAW2X4T0_9LAMI
MLANDRWLARWPDMSYSSLNARTSYHSPLVIRASSQFIPTVQRIWGNSVVGTAMYSVTGKLKALKPLFMAQRKQKGDLSSNVKLAQEFLATLQNLLSQDRHDPCYYFWRTVAGWSISKQFCLNNKCCSRGRSCSG